jgi:RNA polymerase sigma-70 factor, ECF subfamily
LPNVFDRTYLDALQQCDAKAEERLIASFGRPVNLRLRRMFRSIDIADDATQETLLRVLLYFRAGKTLEVPASLPGFVKSVSIYVSMEMLRKARASNLETEELPEVCDGCPDPENMASADEMKRLVHSALKRVSRKDAKLLQRVFFDEVDRDQICRELQVNREYLRVLVHRAKLRVRAAMRLDCQMVEKLRVA